MHRRLLPVVALATLLVLAGCMGGLTDRGTTTAGTTTGTPTTDTTGMDTTTPLGTTTTPTQVAPGLSTAGVENATRLALAHRQALLNASSFTSHQEGNNMRENGTRETPVWGYNRSVDGWFNQPEGRWYTAEQVWDTHYPEARMAIEQVLANNTTSTQRWQPRPYAWEYTTEQTPLTPQEFRQQLTSHTGWRSVNGTLQNFEFSYVETVERQETTLYRFESTAFVGERTDSIPETVTSADATFLVDERGIVHHLTVTYHGTMPTLLDQGPINVSSTFNLTIEDIGSTSVPTPAWAESNQTGETVTDEYHLSLWPTNERWTMNANASQSVAFENLTAAQQAVISDAHDCDCRVSQDVFTYDTKSPIRYVKYEGRWYYIRLAIL